MTMRARLSDWMWSFEKDSSGEKGLPNTKLPFEK